MNNSDKIKDKSEFIQKKTAKLANVFLLIMSKFMNGMFAQAATTLVSKIAQSVTLEQDRITLGAPGNVQGLLSELEFYIQLAHNSGYLNDGQYLIVRDEIRYLKTYIQISGANKAELLADLRFDSKAGIEAELESQYYKGHTALNKRHLSQVSPEEVIKPSESRPVSAASKSVGTTAVVDSVEVVSASPISTRATPVSQTKNSARRSTIVTILKTRPNLTIKDFSHVITDVSEKTIQRELNSLLEEGVVTRSGERRWSKYSLAN